jgi:hypothetical protein
MKNLCGTPRCAIGKYPGAAAVALAASQVKQSSSGSHGWLQIKAGIGLNDPSECSSRATTVLMSRQIKSRRKLDENLRQDIMVTRFADHFDSSISTILRRDLPKTLLKPLFGVSFFPMSS